jgi:hypothetical protein
MDDEEKTQDQQRTGNNNGQDPVEVRAGSQGTESSQTGSSSNGQPTSPDELPTVEGEDDPDLEGPMALYTKPPEEITLEDLNHPDVDEETRQSMIEHYPHLQEQQQERNGSESVDLDEVRSRITGRADQQPTLDQVKEAYLNDDISTAEMEAIRDEASFDTDSGTTARAETQGSDESEPEPEGLDTDDVDPAPTMDDTDLLDEGNEFPWEGEEISSTEVGEQVEHRFTYKQTPLEVAEPENKQRFESQLRLLQNFQDLDDGKREAQARKFSRKLADECLTIDGVPHYEVYVVEHPERGKLTVPDPDGEYGLAEDPGAQEFYQAMNWYDRMMVGRRMSELILGEEKFRSRFD